MVNMGKMIALILGLEILLLLAGMPTGSSSVLNAIGINISIGSEVSSSDLVGFDIGYLNTIILSVIAGAAVIGIGIGVLTKSSPIEYLIVPITTLFATFVISIILISIYALNTYESWVGVIVLLLLVPLAAMYLVSVISWWSNR